MDAATRERYETQSKELRVKIKTWEVDFYKSHDGSKPSRQDIKNNREMAATYKEYQRLRDILDGKVVPPKAGPDHRHDDKENHRKRKSPQQHPSHTPSTKRFRTTAVETPSARRLDPNSTMHMFTPSRAGPGSAATPSSLSRKLFSPAVPTSIGPTPQRDGRVLGLFDSLPFKDAEIDSPCKPNGSVKLSQVIEAGREAMVEETPRKARTADPDLGRTPSSRHSILSRTRRESLLATPLKPHDGNRVAKTPGTSRSVSKLQFQTPAFLRRIPMPKVDENSNFTSPEPIRLPRKPLLRGLSSVVADLRKLQEEVLDDELDALREVENEAAGNKPTKDTAPSSENPDLSKKKQADKDSEASILAEDAQKQNLGLLGGFDDEGQYDSVDEEGAGLDRNGQPLRVFKKKGQKRTTRKSNMKPVRTRRPPTAAADQDDENENPAAQQGADEEDPACLSGSEFAGSDDDEDELAQDIGTIKPKKTAAAKSKAPANKKDAGGKKKSEGTVKKAARKVNELAHANFKRLKLRNNGAKGGPGYNSRFRRRR